MHDNLLNLKYCPKCGALIEAREKVCEYCKHVYEILKLTPEEQAASYAQICEDVNNAFFRLESFMYGNAINYESFNFDRAFSVLFFKTREADNYTPKNFKLISKYWELTQQITYDHDKTNYSNDHANDNEDFVNDLNAIYHLNEDRLFEFSEFSLPEDWEEKRLSILDIKKEFFESLQPEKKLAIKQNPKKSKSKKKKSNEPKNEISKLINELEVVFKYNYPALEKPLQFYNNAKESVRKFKYLVPIKIKNLPSSELKLTLKHFSSVLDGLLEKAQTNFYVIEKWLIKYKVQYHYVINNDTNNELIKFLNEKLPSFTYSLTPEYNKDQEQIQYDFFNYWYGLFLLEALTSVEELREIIDPENVSLGFKSETINNKSMEVKEVFYKMSIPMIPKFPIASVIKQKSDTVPNSLPKKKSKKQIQNNNPQFEEVELGNNDNLLYYQFDRISENVDDTSNSQYKEEPIVIERRPSFKDVFIGDDWHALIAVLTKIEPPLLDKDFKFLGPIRGKKGIICGWILTLQKKGKIKLSVNRQFLSEVLNYEIKDLNLGKDGSTFSKYNKEYEMKWKNELLKLAGLLP